MASSRLICFQLSCEHGQGFHLSKNHDSYADQAICTRR